MDRMKFNTWFFAWLCIATDMGFSNSLIKAGVDQIGEQLRHHIKACGGYVHESLKINDTQHGGASVRGIISTQNLEGGTVVLRIPHSCWNLQGMYPHFMAKVLHFYKSCSDAGADQRFILFGTRFALEWKRRNVSLLTPYLDSLPSLNDLKATLPLFAERAVLDSFGAIPQLRSTRHAQDFQACFDDWRTQDNDVMGLHWENVVGWFSAARARTFGPVKDGLVPFADLLNTDIEDVINTDYGVIIEDDNSPTFILTTSASVAPGTELLASYCKDCDNMRMVMKWGVYLEGNPNRDDRSSRAWCKDEHLKEAALALLEDIRSSQVAVPDKTAPRCKHILGDQAQLRCSLARLSWEFCGCKWEGRACPVGTEHIEL